LMKCNQMVEVPVCGRGQLQRAEANVVEGLVVNAECFVGVLHQLMDRKCGVVRLHHGVYNGT
jgi:hypothetical protein